MKKALILSAIFALGAPEADAQAPAPEAQAPAAQAPEAQAPAAQAPAAQAPAAQAPAAPAAQAPAAQAPAAQALGAPAQNGDCVTGTVISGRMTVTKDQKMEFLDAYISNPRGVCTIRLRHDLTTDAAFWETNPFNPANEDVKAEIVGGQFAFNPDGTATLVVNTKDGVALTFPNILKPQ